LTWELDRRWRQDATIAAELVLSSSGFQKSAACWRGHIAGFDCIIRLLESFPFSLPQIRIDRERHKK
jgi:hypothetical protein